jgi:superfamily I DNA/RNA helicase
LNEEQKVAACAGEGAVMIVAGPGTGKTKTLVARILYLLQNGARPEGILALTFTRKSAEGLAACLQNHKVKASTFHGLCHELLGGQGKFASEPERQAIIRGLDCKKVAVRDAGLLISRAKNTLDFGDENAKKLVDSYNRALAERGLMDFDDLLRLVYGRLKSGELARPGYDHILVDEFQDTNELQYELLKLLKSNDNLFVIGDPHQSIYGFRGASAKVFNRFRSDFPNARNVTLVTNYRSTPQVVALASAIFPGSQLRAHTENAGKIRAVEVLNEYGEADWIVNEIEKEIGGSDMLKSSDHHAAKSQRTFKDFAVLYRTHRSARQVERALAGSGIPYQVAGEGSPYEQPNVAKILNALRYLAAGDAAPLAAQLSLDGQQIQRLLGNLSATEPLPELVEKIIKILNVKADKHLVTFGSSLQRFKENTPQEYLAHLDEIAGQEYYDPAAEVVTLLTIHAAKGLEFVHVFLIAAEQGTLPHKNAEAEEERRLFYVAATRPRENLDILHARSRTRKPAGVSEFVAAVPPEILPHLTDPGLFAQQQKNQKRCQKTAQSALF